MDCFAGVRAAGIGYNGLEIENWLITREGWKWKMREPFENAREVSKGSGSSRSRLWAEAVDRFWKRTGKP